MSASDVFVPIGTAAQKSGCPASTIRYYEEVGLIGTATRSTGGRRHYSLADIARLTFIRRARDFGMSVPQVRGLLDAAVVASESCVPTRAILVERLADIRAKQAELHAFEAQIATMIALCDDSCGQSGADCVNLAGAMKAGFRLPVRANPQPV